MDYLGELVSFILARTLAIVIAFFFNSYIFKPSIKTKYIVLKYLIVTFATWVLSIIMFDTFLGSFAPIIAKFFSDLLNFFIGYLLLKIWVFK